MSVNTQRALHSVRDWDKNFPIGTTVIFEGRETVTESHAGMTPKDEPCVFVRGVEAPVPLMRLTVPGWEFVTRRRR